MARHALIRDQAAIEEEKRLAAEQLEADGASLERQRAQLRDDVVAGVKRDHEQLLAEVGELEPRRRRWAFLPDHGHEATATPGRWCSMTA